MKIIVLAILSLIVSCDEAIHPNAKYTVEIDIGRDGFICSALEYQKNIYITSAHCVPSFHQNRIKIDNKFLKAKEIIIHPQWDSLNIRFDIALVVMGETEGEAHFEIEQVQTLDEIESVVMQLGKKEVKKHRVEILGQDRFGTKDIQGQLCKGNSGSPAYIKIEEKYYLVGIASGITREVNLCNDGGYSVFADVYYVKDWIIDQVSSYSKRQFLSMAY